MSEYGILDPHNLDVYPAYALGPRSHEDNERQGSFVVGVIALRE